jgi:hypothetical protein
MTSAPEAAELVTTNSSTDGRHMARRLKSSVGGVIVTFGGDLRCIQHTQDKDGETNRQILNFYTLRDDTICGIQKQQDRDKENQ